MGNNRLTKYQLQLMKQTDEEIRGIGKIFGVTKNINNGMIKYKNMLLEQHNMTREEAEKQYKEIVKREYQACENMGITLKGFPKVKLPYNTKETKQINLDELMSKQEETKSFIEEYEKFVFENLKSDYESIIKTRTTIKEKDYNFVANFEYIAKHSDYILKRGEEIILYLNILREKFKELGIDYKNINYKEFMESLNEINKKNVRYE